MDYEKEIPFGAFDSELMHQEITIPEGFTATIDGDKIILTKTESEDEKIRKSLLEYLHTLPNHYSHNGVCAPEWIAWLEKQGKEDSFIQQAYEQGYTEGKRIERKHWIEKQNFSEDYNSIDPQFGKPIEQNPAEWSEEDEKMFKSLNKILNEASCYSCTEGIDKILSWFKYLRERIQPKQEWSEEDESWFKELELMALSFLNDVFYLKKFFDWLKFLKDKYTWKPSIAQLNALSIVSKGNAPDDIEAIVSLYNDLKKLREE